MNMAGFSSNERADLQCFLEASRQIQESSVVSSGQSLGMRFAMANDGTQTHEIDLFHSELFRSLAMSVRLIYLNDEPSNFGHICNVLRRRRDPALHKHVDLVRAAYNNLLHGKRVQFGLHGDFEGRIVGPREVLEAWLYGYAFHHKDPETRALYEELCKFGPRFTFGVQTIVMELALSVENLRALVEIALRDELTLDQHGPSAT